MNYFFIFGNHPDISLVELTSKLQSEQYSFSLIQYVRNIGVFTLEKELPHSFIHSLGGIVKYGVCFEKQFSRSTLSIGITEYLKTLLQEGVRLTFGLSVYVKNIALHRAGIEIKKTLKEDGHSVRFVAPPRNEYILSSVTVQKNNLLDATNAELNVFELNGQLVIGKTVFVQAFEEYSYRDWQRPQKDMTTGLLPPKVAQIMINCAGLSPLTQPRIHDPFCGFGTIIQEALCMGYSQVSGSDVSKERIQDSKKNIEWLFKEHITPQREVYLFQSNATQLNNHIASATLDAIIAEPYLGPPNKNGQSPQNALIHELSILYKKSFEVFYPLLKKNGVVVFLLPVWQTSSGPFFMPVLQDIIQIGFSHQTIPPRYSSLLLSKTKRDTLVYMRAGQGVARELCVFIKR